MTDAITRDRLTRDIWLYQRSKGHRFSSDDLVTAYVAHQAAPAAARILDLGCGIGTVLLHLAWSIPAATLVGIEAQDLSYDLLGKNVAESGLADRIAIHHGDLRDAELGSDFSLVTGTPPYFPLGTSVEAMDVQRAYARIEYRGGVEAYVAAGARALAAGGVMVVCGDASAGDRVAAAATTSDLHLVARCDVIPRAGEPPLFAVWTLAHRRPDAIVVTALTLRDAAGEKTPDAARLRAFSGL